MKFARISDGRPRALSGHVEHNRMIFCQKPPDARFIYGQKWKSIIYAVAQIYLSLLIPSSVEQESVVNSAGVAMFCPTRRRLY
jgi:hypothetical protein